MDAAQIAAMIVDINVGTEPHWWRDQLEFYLDEDNGYSDQKTADYRRIARVPDMEAAIIAQAAELERLHYVLGGVKSAIDTGRNEPLQIWRDQIEIAISAQGQLKGGTK